MPPRKAKQSAAGSKKAKTEEKSEQRNILVTGGSGFIASHLCSHLAGKYPHYNVVNYDALLPCSSQNNNKAAAELPNYKFARGEVQNTQLVDYVMKTFNIDTVMHFAAHSHVDESFGNSVQFTNTNILGTHTMLECSKQNNIKLFIHVSSDEVLGDKPSHISPEIAKMVEPTNPYGCSKAAAELITKAYVRSYKLPVIVVRGCNVYGPGQFPEKLIPKLVLRLMRGQKACVYGDGSQIRNFVHVRDSVEAFDTILHKGQIHQTYNVGTVSGISVMDLSKKIIRFVGAAQPGEEDSKIEAIADPHFNDSRFPGDISSLKALGWSEKVGFDEGLKETIEWYKSVPQDYWPAYTSFDQILTSVPVHNLGFKF